MSSLSQEQEEQAVVGDILTPFGDEFAVKLGQIAHVAYFHGEGVDFDVPHIDGGALLRFGRLSLRVVSRRSPNEQLLIPYDNISPISGLDLPLEQATFEHASAEGMDVVLEYKGTKVVFNPHIPEDLRHES